MKTVEDLAIRENSIITSIFEVEVNVRGFHVSAFRFQSQESERYTMGFQMEAKFEGLLGILKLHIL